MVKEQLTAAVLCANGLGDGLLMMICAAQLKKNGYDVTVYHDVPHLFSDLFPDCIFSPHLPDERILELENYDLVILENDHSKKAWDLFALREKGRLPHLRVFFPTPSKAQKPSDILFHRRFPVARNIAIATQFILQTADDSMENGLRIPEGKTFRKYKRRIVIHPTSKDSKRNWSQDQFISFARRLKKAGYKPVFALAEFEKEEWLFLQKEGFATCCFPKISDLASYIYESGYFIGNDSGLGHLASNLLIPTLTISGNKKRALLWRPNWTIGVIATPFFPLPNFKGIGLPLREWMWQDFVSEKKVWKAFGRLVTHDAK